MNAIDVPFKCRCMPAESVAQVPGRRDGEDIAQWMELCLQPAIYLKHRMLSPRCTSSEIEYAKVPFHESNPVVGGQAKLS